MFHNNTFTQIYFTEIFVFNKKKFLFLYKCRHWYKNNCLSNYYGTKGINTTGIPGIHLTRNKNSTNYEITTIKYLYKNRELWIYSKLRKMRHAQIWKKVKKLFLLSYNNNTTNNINIVLSSNIFKELIIVLHKNLIIPKKVGPGIFWSMNKNNTSN